jgi:hypothetical protein
MSTIENVERAGDDLTTAWADAKCEMAGKDLSDCDVATLEKTLKQLGDTLCKLEELDDEIVLSAQEVLFKSAMSDYEYRESPFETVSLDLLNPDKDKGTKMWRSNKRIWETSDGRLVPEQNGRIPADAVRLAVGIGGQIPEEVAKANGLIEGVI